MYAMKIQLSLVIWSIFGNSYTVALGFSCGWYETIHLPHWKVHCFDTEDSNVYGCLFKPEYKVVEHTKVLIARGCIAPQGDIYMDEGGDTVYYKRLYCNHCSTVKLPYIKPENKGQNQSPPPSTGVSGNINAPIVKGSSVNHRTASSDSDDASDSSRGYKQHRTAAVGAKHGNGDNSDSEYNSDSDRVTNHDRYAVGDAQTGYNHGRVGGVSAGSVSNGGTSNKRRAGPTVTFVPSSSSENDSQDNDRDTFQKSGRTDKETNGSDKRGTSIPGKINGKNVNVKVNVRVNIKEDH